MISVIIPTYNPVRYLAECLDSLSHQTIQEFEIVVVLNHANPDTEAAAKQTISSCSRPVHFVSIPQTGVSHARNAGINAATGDYITFLDDDDYLSPTALERMQQGAVSDGIICCDVQCVHPTTGALSTDYLHACYIRNKGKEATLWSSRSYFSTSCCKLIPKNILQDTRFNPHFEVGEDSLFMAQLAHRVKRILFTEPDAFYYRRLSIGSASRTPRTNGWKICQCIRQNTAFLKAWIRHPKIDPRFPISRIIGTIYNMK